MKKHYQEIVDEVIGQHSSHRTLRTLFDPGSSEWNDTTMDKKLELLKKILDSGKISFPSLIFAYTLYYKKESPGREYVADALPEGLALLLEFSLKK